MLHEVQALRVAAAFRRAWGARQVVSRGRALHGDWQIAPSLSEDRLVDDRSPWFVGSIGAVEGSPARDTGDTLSLSGPHKIRLSPGWPAEWRLDWRKAETTLLLLGPLLEPRSSLDKIARDAIATGSYVDLIKLVPCCTVIVDDGDKVLVSSDIVGLRPIFVWPAAAGAIYSSSLNRLRRMVKADVSNQWLAIHLAWSDNAIPSLSPFRGIYTVAPGHWLRVDGRTLTTRRFWRAPQGTLGLKEGAEALRVELIKSVGKRIEYYRNVSADLSGGFDSSTLASIAAKQLQSQGRRLKAIQAAFRSEKGFTDRDYAQAVTDSWGNVDLTVLDLDTLPAPLSEENSPVQFEEPALALVSRSRTAQLFRWVHSVGSDVHISGEGGDAVVEVARSSYLADLLRRGKARTALKHSVRAAGLIHESASEGLRRALRLSFMGYRSWMNQEAHVLARGQSNTAYGWGPPFRRLPWLTKFANELTIRHIQRAALAETPHADHPGQHTAVSSMLMVGRSCRIGDVIARAEGAWVDYPFLDPTVVEACLSVRIDARSDPIALKPLLVEAFRDLLPAGFFDRTQKSSPWFFSRQLYKSFRRAYPFVEEVFRAPLLAERSLIHPEQFLSAAYMVVMAPRLIRRWDTGRVLRWACAGLVLAPCVLLLAHAGGSLKLILLSVASSGIMGTAGGLAFGLIMDTLRQTTSQSKMLGRIAAVQSEILAGAAVAGALVGGLLGKLLGPYPGIALGALFEFATVPLLRMRGLADPLEHRTVVG